ncbi:MAG: hypothetical protein RDU30_09360 [Desulfovibrionaceae bacterium]|nr:hypothetical protein [Desulfovibrionaceae bacterium]
MSRSLRPLPTAAVAESPRDWAKASLAASSGPGGSTVTATGSPARAKRTVPKVSAVITCTVRIAARAARRSATPGRSAPSLARVPL